MNSSLEESGMNEEGLESILDEPDVVEHMSDEEMESFLDELGIVGYLDDGNNSSDATSQLQPHDVQVLSQQQQVGNVTANYASGEGLDPDELQMAFTEQDEAAELASMSFADLFSVESDLRGITEGMSGLGLKDESPDLKGLEEGLSRLPPEQTVAYYRAVAECPGLVSNQRKIAFLQREKNNSVCAAVRLALYWKERLELFGPDRCFLPMTLNGAMKDEVENIVERKLVHLLPVKDAAGRAVLFFDPSRRNFAEYSAEQEMMATWYFLEVAMEDPEVQRRGVVSIINAKGTEKRHYSREFYSRMTRIIGLAMPVYFRGTHSCYPSFFANYFLYPILKLLIGKDLRQRFKLHYGTTAEVLHDLERYCLPKNHLPVDIGGDITLDMAKWVSDRRALEESRPDPRFVADQQRIIRPGGPASKRGRDENTVSSVEEAVAASVNQDEVIDKQKRKKGRPSDPRMAGAVKARLADPDLSLQDALQKGGFTFESTNGQGHLVDADNITAIQRKNQLSRRIRQVKARLEQQQQGNQADRVLVDALESSSSSTDSSSSTQAQPSVVASPPTVNAMVSVQRRDSFDEAISDVPEP